MSDVGEITARLQGVKSSGQDRWIARCPAHEDRSPSLAVRALPDGRVLMHCFAGCDTEAILGAIGLKFTDLFAEPLAHHFAPTRAPFSAREALECLTGESAIVLIVGSDIADGKGCTPKDADRLALALGRITAAMEVVHGF
jgi:hypothetical protein